jgi:hypothetical protein
MPSETILEKVLEYCEEYDKDISEILDIFDDKNKKAEFYAELVMEGNIKDPEFKAILEKRIENELDEWE